MLRRRKWIVIAVTLFGALNAFAYASLQKNVYQASVLMRVETAGSAGTSYSDQINASIALAKTFVVEITNGGFIQQAAKSLKTTPCNISSRVSAGVVTDAPLIRINVTGSIAEGGARSRSRTRTTPSRRSRRSTSQAPRSRSGRCRRSPTRSAIASTGSSPGGA